MDLYTRRVSRWRRPDAWREAQLILLAGLVLGAFVRLAFDFDADALTIAGLSALLFWVQFAEWRRARGVEAKLDQVLARQRYGPLSDEDLEAINALKAQAQRQAGASTRRA